MTNADIENITANTARPMAGAHQEANRRRSRLGCRRIPAQLLEVLLALVIGLGALAAVLLLSLPSRAR